MTEEELNEAAHRRLEASEAVAREKGAPGRSGPWLEVRQAEVKLGLRWLESVHVLVCYQLSLTGLLVFFSNPTCTRRMPTARGTGVLFRARSWICAESGVLDGR